MHFISFSFDFMLVEVQAIFDNIYVLLIGCKFFFYIRKQIVTNCFFHGKIHVEKKD